MSVGLKRNAAFVEQQRSYSWVVLAQNRSRPSQMKRVHKLKQLVSGLFDLFFRSEVVRQVGPEHRPERRHQWDYKHHWINHQML